MTESKGKLIQSYERTLQENTEAWLEKLRREISDGPKESIQTLVKLNELAKDLSEEFRKIARVYLSGNKSEFDQCIEREKSMQKCSETAVMLIKSRQESAVVQMDVSIVRGIDKITSEIIRDVHEAQKFLSVIQRAPDYLGRKEEFLPSVKHSLDSEQPERPKHSRQGYIEPSREGTRRVTFHIDPNLANAVNEIKRERGTTNDYLAHKAFALLLESEGVAVPPTTQRVLEERSSPKKKGPQPKQLKVPGLA